MENIKANIQLMDNYIKEYSMKLKERIPQNTQLKLGCSITFEVTNIKENDKGKVGQVNMEYNINLIQNEQDDVGNIHLIMQALFSTDKSITNDKFEDMLKNNGAPVLAQIIRSYIIANTSLSEMPTIKFPLINFVEFFKNAKKEN